MNRIANFFSYVFHPVFMPMYGLLLLMYSPATSYGLINTSLYHLSAEIKYVFIGFFAILTIVAPILSIMVLRKNQFIQSIHMHTKEERTYTLILISVYYIIMYLYTKFQIYSVIKIPFIMPFIFGFTLSVLIALIINKFTKISLHSLGIFGTAGALTAYYQSQLIFDMNLLILVLILAGLLSSFRLFLKAHNLTQVFLGGLVGYWVTFICMKFDLFL